jgi:hypothetical protein
MIEMLYGDKEKLMKAWVSFLEARNYDVFGTQTFASKNPKLDQQTEARRMLMSKEWQTGRAINAGAAIRRTRRVLKIGCKKIKIPLNAFVVAEEHYLGTWHAHWMLRSGTEKQETLEQVCEVFKAIGTDVYGWARSQPIEKSEAVRKYVSKYMLKKKCEYEILGR